MRKTLLCFILILSFVLPCGCATSTPATEEAQVRNTVFEINGEPCDVGDYLETEELFLMELAESGNTDYELYDSSELTADILENRNGTLVIERCIGLVTSRNEGDGIVLNAYDEDYNYISYRGVSSTIRDGTVLLSYMVYNPGNNYIDDIMERHDFVICREYED